MSMRRDDLSKPTSTAPLRLGVLVAMLGLASIGCSALFAQGPPPNHEQAPPFDCTSGYGLPIADTGLTILGGGVTFLVLAGPSVDAGGGSKKLLAASVLSLPFFFLPLASTIYGYRTVGRCRDAERAQAARRAGQVR